MEFYFNDKFQREIKIKRGATGGRTRVLTEVVFSVGWKSTDEQTYILTEHTKKTM